MILDYRSTKRSLPVKKNQSVDMILYRLWIGFSHHCSNFELAVLKVLPTN